MGDKEFNSKDLGPLPQLSPEEATLVEERWKSERHHPGSRSYKYWDSKRPADPEPF